MDMTLVIMAAGMGSRYGGLKQIAPVGKSGEIIMEYAISDAMQAGFNHVVFVIKEEMAQDFKEVVGDRVAKSISVDYAFQKLTSLPEGFSVPEGRVKPWGTGHAMLAAKPYIKGAFCVINADDFYGRDAFLRVGSYLKTATQTAPLPGCMAGYQIENTLTDNGTVARGVCITDENGALTSVTERTKLHRVGDMVVDDESGAETPIGTPVSLNMWGFSHGVLEQLEGAFKTFLTHNDNPLKGEFFLPTFVSGLIDEKLATVQVLSTTAQWYGVTYQEDRQGLVDAIDALTQDGTYQSPLFT